MNSIDIALWLLVAIFLILFCGPIALLAWCIGTVVYGFTVSCSRTGEHE